MEKFQCTITITIDAQNDHYKCQYINLHALLNLGTLFRHNYIYMLDFVLDLHFQFFNCCRSVNVISVF